MIGPFLDVTEMRKRMKVIYDRKLIDNHEKTEIGLRN